MSKHPEIIQLAKSGNFALLRQATYQPAFFEAADCDQSNAELFFSDDQSQVAEAKSICAACPIQLKCFEWGMAHEQDGIYGGSTPQERELLRQGNPVVDLEQVRRMQRDKELIMLKPVKVVASIFEVEPRTVHRWRNEINAAEKKAG